MCDTLVESEQLADTDTELGQEIVTRKLYSKIDSLIVVFSLIAAMEGMSAFVETYGFTIVYHIRNSYNPPFWYTINPILGLTPIELLAELIFPVLLFVLLYELGDRIKLEENVLPLSIASAFGGAIGYFVGFAVGAYAFQPFNPLFDIEGANGLAEVIFRGFFAFAVGLSAVLLRQLRTKAIWIV